MRLQLLSVATRAATSVVESVVAGEAEVDGAAELAVNGVVVDAVEVGEEVVLPVEAKVLQQHLPLRLQRLLLHLPLLLELFCTTSRQSKIFHDLRAHR